MNDDAHIPKPSDSVKGLLKKDSPTETADVMALVGYVGPGRNQDIRLYPDIDFQRWMDIARDEIVASSPLDAFNSGRLERTVVWVKTQWMMDPVFKPNAFQNIQSDFVGSWMSTWPLIPGSRYVAAQILDLLPGLTHGENRERGYT
jgi:hypothetical protein